MPIDVTQLVPQLQRMTDRARENRERRERLMAQMRRVFDIQFDAAAWNEVCDAAAQLSGVRWFGARFDDAEPANQFIPTSAGAEPHVYALIASDGSQIMPNRHKSVQYAAIQVASACIVYGQATDSLALANALKHSRRKPLRFMGEEELIDDNTGELISAGEISTERDLQEIELLAENCEHFRAAGVLPVAVADASLVPFSLLNEVFVRNSPRRASQQLTRITAALTRMRRCNAIVGGYIDRPNSNAVARSCALADIPATAATDEAQLRELVRKAEQGIHTISDRGMLEPILPPGQRTALFEPTWLINGPSHLGKSGHTMRACYLNIGRTRPNIVRLEIPAWCAGPDPVGILTAVMLRHARMGSGYPLCLKAAHEEALLSHTDEREIDQIIERGLIGQGILATPSSKQEAKDKR
jgi:hypothetical protein